MPKLVNNKKKNLSIITQPWFVIIVVISCFGILTPKIFMPLFRQITGSGRTEQQDRVNHNMRMRPMPGPPSGPPADHGDFSRAAPQFGRPAPTYGQQSSSGGSKSLLTFLLPVYATGIGIYMVYTLFKVFNKKDEDEKKEEDEEEEYESSKKKNYKFLEKNLNTANVRWDANEGEFKYVNKTTSHFKQSEESEDESNDYERYKNLDPDYVEFLKQKRRLQREQAKKESLESTTKASLKSDQIPLSPGSGITSITNTNVLMNDTLERMKYSLNKINNQLIEVEKKGGPLDDPELENLKFQLTQTETQMAKIMNIVNNVSNTIQGNYAKQTQPEKILIQQDKEENEREDDNDEDEENLDSLHRQVELIKQVVSTAEKCKKSRKHSNKNVYEKIKQNITEAEQMLRQRRKKNELESQIINQKLNEQTIIKNDQNSSESVSLDSSVPSSNQNSDNEKDLIYEDNDENLNDVDADDDDDNEDDFTNDYECDSDQSSDNQIETLNSRCKDKNI